jgi:aminoglycoside phosphotransferase
VDERPDLELAVAALEPGGRLLGVQPLTGGVSAEVLGLDIVTAAGEPRRAVYRRHRAPDFKQQDRSVTVTEFGVLTALHGTGLAVPEPYLCHDDGAGPGPYLLMEWVDGSTEVDEDDLPEALDQMARFLVALHTVDASAPPLSELDPVEDPRSSIADLLPPTEAGARVRRALGTGALATDLNPAVVLHGDYWPGNVIWRHGRLAAVIDWEDACLGDPLADLATARVELLCRYGAEAMDRFTHRYLQVADDALGSLPLGSLPIWELYVSAAALATMGDWGLDPVEEAHRRRMTGAFFERAAGELG